MQLYDKPETQNLNPDPLFSMKEAAVTFTADRNPKSFAKMRIQI